jgi:CheY-like chemotaxis protein
MRAVTEGLGFRVVEAVTGEEAVQQLGGRDDFALMLLDLKMPGMDGLEVLTHVRTTLKTAALPVIIMTASSDTEDENRLLAAGANDYIKKPIDPPWAVNRVQAVIRRAQS